MKKKPTPKTLTFKEWYNSLNKEQQRAAMAHITIRTITKKSTVNNWLYGNCRIPPLAQPIINDIAAQQLDYSFVKSNPIITHNS